MPQWHHNFACSLTHGKSCTAESKVDFTVINTNLDRKEGVEDFETYELDATQQK